MTLLEWLDNNWLAFILLGIIGLFLLSALVSMIEKVVDIKKTKAEEAREKASTESLKVRASNSAALTPVLEAESRCNTSKAMLTEERRKLLKEFKGSGMTEDEWFKLIDFDGVYKEPEDDTGLENPKN